MGITGNKDNPRTSIVKETKAVDLVGKAIIPKIDPTVVAKQFIFDIN